MRKKSHFLLRFDVIDGLLNKIHNSLTDINKRETWSSSKFYNSDLSIDEMIKNMGMFIDRCYKGDEDTINYPPSDEDFDESLNFYTPIKNKVESLEFWLNDIYELRKDAKNQTQEDKAKEIEKWIQKKIDELNNVKKLTVDEYALYYYYTIKNKELKFKNIEEKYPDMNIKDAYAEFATKELKLKGKTSFYIKSRMYDKKQNRINSNTVKYLKRVIIILKDENKINSYKEASEELIDANKLYKAS